MAPNKGTWSPTPRVTNIKGTNFKSLMDEGLGFWVYRVSRIYVGHTSTNLNSLTVVL